MLLLLPASSALRANAPLLLLCLILALALRPTVSSALEDPVATELPGVVPGHPANDPHRGPDEDPSSEAHDEHEHEHVGEQERHDDANDRETSAQKPDEQDHGHRGFTGVHLSPEQLRTLGIATSVLERRALGEPLRGPGEVRPNAYATAQVTPRIAAQVVARHARLGEEVAHGQPLVTLSSVEMAVAQGDLVVAEREWRRLTKLKGQFVSESEYLEASVARQKALSRVLAYGMTRTQVEALTTAASEKADGTFELLAPQGGTVVRDAFVLGELVTPGRVLFEITDESVRWVEAQMPPEEASRVSLGDRARVTYRESWLDGRVIQIHHLLDESTRTQAVRVEVPDPAHRLHPGVFVEVSILARDDAPVLVLPEEAVLRAPDGDWLVFVADGEDVFRPAEVELRRAVGGLAVIEGLPEGTSVVTEGAFFLQSELAKGGFDPHNH